MILTVSGDNPARVWDTDTGQPLTPMLALDGPVRSAAFAADNSRVSVYFRDGRVQTWDLRPETRSLEEIECQAHLLSGAYIHSQHGVLPLPHARLRDLSRRLAGQ
jgi:WD40 repeat protein